MWLHRLIVLPCAAAGRVTASLATGSGSNLIVSNYDVSYDPPFFKSWAGFVNLCCCGGYIFNGCRPRFSRALLSNYVVSTHQLGFVELKQSSNN